MLVAFDVRGEAEGVAEAKHSSDVMIRRWWWCSHKDM